MGALHPPRCCRGIFANPAMASPPDCTSYWLARPSRQTSRMTSRPSPEPVSLSLIALVFSRIGVLSFGGGLIAWMHREAVEARRWLNDQEFLSGLAICQVLPGGNMVNMSLYLGVRLRGALGAVTAILGLIGLPIVIVIAIAAVYANFDTLRSLHLVLDGIAAAAVGMNITTGIKAARRNSRALAPIAIAGSVFAAVGIFHWPMLAVVAGLAPLSIALAWRSRHG
jgi:chromate transporter